MNRFVEATIVGWPEQLAARDKWAAGGAKVEKGCGPSQMRSTEDSRWGGLMPSAKAVAVAVAFGVALFWAAAAVAQTYGSSGLSISVVHPLPGQSVQLVAMGFKPGSMVTDAISSTPIELGTATVDANGTASLTATIPASLAAGSTHEISASGAAANGSPLTESLSITLGSATTTTASSTLALTGGHLAELGGVALAVLASGSFFVFVTHRRRRLV